MRLSYRRRRSSSPSLPLSIVADAQTGGLPHVELEDAPLMRLSGDVDSNSPAIWDRVFGRNTLFVMTSFDGRPSTASGRNFAQLSRPAEAVVDPWPGGGVWMEAVLKDDDGDLVRLLPQRERRHDVPGHRQGDAADRRGALARSRRHLGAARRRPRGAAPLVRLHDQQPLLRGRRRRLQRPARGDVLRTSISFTRCTCAKTASQGVGVARLAWADRDDPRGKIMIWRSGAGCRPPRFATPPANAGPTLPRRRSSPPSESWHDDDPDADAFWGPSVHWNTYLGRFVMLLNRAKNAELRSGRASTFPTRRSWRIRGSGRRPVKILNGGRWYPQVLGLEDGSGTDKTAGEWARFFMQGSSRHFIRFSK